LKIFAHQWEHPSVLEPLKIAQEFEHVQLELLQDFDLLKAIKPAAHSQELQLVTLTHVSHETGDINDISAIASQLKKENPALIIHVDGVQGFCKEKLDLANIDMYSFSGHKIHGGTGAGGLFVRKGIRIFPLLHGGGQEFGSRAGTENVCGILQMTSAAKQLMHSFDENHARVTAVKTELAKLPAELPDCFINSASSIRETSIKTSPYILNISFLGIKGETLVHLLSEKKIYASMGAACRSRKKVKSTLETMGFSAERAGAAVRFSFSHLNTVEEAVHVRKTVVECVNQMRRVLGRR
jgi:cysteine desulfurase